MLTSAALLVPRFVYATDDLGIVLTVPFAAQQYTGDCGETCVHMLSLWRADVLRMPSSTALTAAQIRTVWGKSADEWALWREHLWLHLADVGFAGIANDAADERWYRERLALGCPCVALTYNSWSEPHYVVVVAADDNGVVVHDPNGYEGLRVSWHDWLFISQGVGIAITGFV